MWVPPVGPRIPADRKPPSATGFQKPLPPFVDPVRGLLFFTSSLGPTCRRREVHRPVPPFIHHPSLPLLLTHAARTLCRAAPWPPARRLGLPLARVFTWPPLRPHSRSPPAIPRPALSLCLPVSRARALRHGRTRPELAAASSPCLPFPTPVRTGVESSSAPPSPSSSGIPPLLALLLSRALSAARHGQRHEPRRVELAPPPPRATFASSDACPVPASGPSAESPHSRPPPSVLAPFPRAPSRAAPAAHHLAAEDPLRATSAPPGCLRWASLALVQLTRPTVAPSSAGTAESSDAPPRSAPSSSLQFAHVPRQFRPSRATRSRGKRTPRPGAPLATSSAPSPSFCAPHRTRELRPPRALVH